MRACAKIREPFCQAHGIAYGPIVETWALMAEQAENWAENKAHERAMRAASRR